MFQQKDGGEGDGLTVCVLGCGTMGISILSGTLTSLAELDAPKPLQAPTGSSTPPEVLPERLPTRFIACVRTAESAKKVKAALWEHTTMLQVVYSQNVSAVSKSEVVLLACKPYMVKDILAEDGMATALQGKLLISVCAGVTAAQIEEQLEYLNTAAKASSSSGSGKDSFRTPVCRVVRAMPNTASLIRESMTVIATPTPPLPAPALNLVTWLFRRVGEVVHLPPSAMDASTALCASGPAFFALMLEAAADGAVAMGLPRVEAQRMAAQAMKGAAGLVLSGEHPALLRDKVSTPGGCTIGGLLVLEEGTVRGTISKAIRESACVASQLGKGVQGVNGTRFQGGQ